MPLSPHATVAILLSLALVIVPPMVLPHPADAPLSLPLESTSTCHHDAADPIPYAELTPHETRVFDSALQGTSTDLRSRSDFETVQTFRETPCVTKDGTTYQVAVSTTDSGSRDPLVGGLVRYFLVGFGGAIGLVVLYERTRWMDSAVGTLAVTLLPTAAILTTNVVQFGSLSAMTWPADIAFGLTISAVLLSYRYYVTRMLRDAVGLVILGVLLVSLVAAGNVSVLVVVVPLGATAFLGLPVLRIVQTGRGRSLGQFQ